MRKKLKKQSKQTKKTKNVEHLCQGTPLQIQKYNKACEGQDLSLFASFSLQDLS